MDATQFMADSDPAGEWLGTGEGKYNLAILNLGPAYWGPPLCQEPWQLYQAEAAQGKKKPKDDKAG